ncbi:hypothetical protein SYMBAF_17025 (plasmid) [Serratia symbiotica]|uniref:Trimeric autotransporter adhesin YadA-like C-terminal membrane anchor domain-containing protein n=1 Tax=Serratia symbiotica TaxID=138074 RepID=A0A7D5SQK3_9GAMM|nr:hypothetical protein SYMBAF_17025 [Serratia symbiotica]
MILGEGGVADEQSVVVGGDASKALGVAVGNGAKGGYNAVSVGQGATTEKASFGVAVGAESAALSSGPQGQGSVAVGTRATAGYGGVGLGYGANATNGGVALGTGSLTARFDEVNVGERFISGVKAGTSKTDAANVGQVQVSNANTLAVANAHSDTGNADTLRAARSHTDERETATNARTDALLKVEQTARNEAIANESQARRDGDAATLKSANDYTNWRVDTLNIDTADTLRQSQTYTDTRANEARYYTDSKFSQLNTRIERAEKRLHAGIAGVAAIASIPYVASNRFSYGVAVGNYQSANALAGGIQYKTSPNTTIRLNVSLDSSDNAALAVGVGGGW